MRKRLSRKEMAGWVAVTVLLLTSCILLAAENAETYPPYKARVYSDRNLATISIPVGGIAAGQLWFDGMGDLDWWDIFNAQYSYSVLGRAPQPMSYKPPFFSAIRTATPDGKTVVKALNRSARFAPFQPVKDLSFTTEFPFNTYHLSDPDLPLKVHMEIFSPFIPWDVEDSILPCVIFNYRLENPGASPVKASILMSVPNMVGFNGVTTFTGEKRKTTVSVEKDGASLEMTAPLGTRPKFASPMKALQRYIGRNGAIFDWWIENLTVANHHLVRGKSIQEYPVYWFICDSPHIDWVFPELKIGFERHAQQGGVLLLTGLGEKFLEVLQAAARSAPATEKGAQEIFEDFEGDFLKRWEVQGEAFRKPTPWLFFQGFLGCGYAHSENLPENEARGRLLSKPFKVAKDFIYFLIAGGDVGHFGPKTCLNLLVDGQVVAFKCGKGNDILAPDFFDVRAFKGKEARLEIVDDENGAGPRGCVAVDHIVFCDGEPSFVREYSHPEQYILNRIPAVLEAVTPATGRATVEIKPPADSPFAALGSLRIDVTRTLPLKIAPKGREGDSVVVLAVDEQKRPIGLGFPYGKGRVIMLFCDLDYQDGWQMVGNLVGNTFSRGKDVPSPFWGTMTAEALSPSAVGCAGWRDLKGLFEKFQADPRSIAQAGEAVTAEGREIAGALTAEVEVLPGQTREVPFFVTWHFPHAWTIADGHSGAWQNDVEVGNYYNCFFKNAQEVAAKVKRDFKRLDQYTRRYHEAMFKSTLPEEIIGSVGPLPFLIRMNSWSESGQFYDSEALCTHVVGYSQGYNFLMPALAENIWGGFLLENQRSDGQIPMRQFYPKRLHDANGWPAAADGQAATILSAYRLHLLSEDGQRLRKLWPSVQKAMEWMVKAYDSDEDGVPTGLQIQTYDAYFADANTFIGSYYLAALAACAEMATIEGDAKSAERYQRILENGRRKQNELLWNGEYYIQKLFDKKANDYLTGCFSDQLIGQWWANMLGLKPLYPRDRVRATLSSILKYNFRPNFKGVIRSRPGFSPEERGGLFNCTWPKGDRPLICVYYDNEVWTGVEYEIAADMIYEGMTQEGLKVLRTMRERYDGVFLNPISNCEGPSFYPRGLSGWTVLTAAQGFRFDGPKGLIGFAPHINPANHRSFFSYPNGWGTFEQLVKDGCEIRTIKVLYGSMRFRELEFELKEGRTAGVTVHHQYRSIPFSEERLGNILRIKLKNPLLIRESELLIVSTKEEKK